MKRFLVLLALAIFLGSSAPAFAERSPQIVNGTEAAPGSYPFYVALSNKQYKNGKAITCGGQLVDEQWVLTAAHCLEAFPSYRPTRFTPGLETLADLGNLPSAGMEEFFFLPGREPNPLFVSDRDAVLVKLSRPMPGPTVALAEENPPLGSEIITAGFGQLGTYKKPARTLQEVTLRVPERQSCRKMIGISINNPSVLCANKTNKGVCFGDSGGPALFAGQLVGITSFVTYLCGGGQSGFTSAAQIRPWVEKMTRGGGQTGRVSYSGLERYARKAFFYFATDQRPERITLRVKGPGCRKKKCRTVRTITNPRLGQTFVFRIPFNRARCLRVSARIRFSSGDQTNTVTRVAKRCRRR